MKKIGLLAALLRFLLVQSAIGADDVTVGSRHIRRYVQPPLPDIAKTMDLKGTVKLEVEIVPNGDVSSVKPLGGHSLLLDCAGRAVKNWQFDTAAETTTGPVTIIFH